MNVRKTIFAAGGSVIILLLLGLRLGWFGKFGKESPRSETAPSAVRPAKKTPEPAAKAVKRPPESAKNLPAPAAAPKPAAVPKPAPQKTTKVSEEDPGLGDPFVYANTATGDYSPLSGNRPVGVITVKGIIAMKGEEPRAILHLKDSDRVHYVTKNSVVRISAKGKKGAGPAEAYIVVKEIRNDEVELIQLERPDKVIIIR